MKPRQLLSIIGIILLSTVLALAANQTLENNAGDNGTGNTSDDQSPEEPLTTNNTGNKTREEPSTNATGNATTNAKEPVIKEQETVLAEQEDTTEPVDEIVAFEEKLSSDARKAFRQPEKEERLLIKHTRRLDKNVLDDYRDKQGRGWSAIKAKPKDLTRILTDKEITHVELDQEIETFSEQVPWNIKHVGASDAWNESVGTGIKVGVLDTGIGPHDELEVVGGRNVIDDNDDYSDNHGHGTKVAGVIAATADGEGLIGTSPDAQLYAIKIMESETGHLSDAIAGLEWATENEIDIISMSFGFEGYSQLFKEAVQEAYENGALLIAASGNDGSQVTYPAAYADVIAVGATDKDDERASFSNYGFELELAAPGVDINTTSLIGYSTGWGTSLAAPHVAGVAALIWADNQSLSNEQIRARLQNDAQDLGEEGKDDETGYGLVQAKLNSTNITPHNDSYYYEIHNISNHGQQNQTTIFWLSGTGTIDDVNFKPGYYQIIKYLEPIMNETWRVNENGIAVLLDTISGTMLFQDDYAYEGGNTSDGILWIDGYLDFALGEDTSQSHSTIDGECYDTTGIGTGLGETDYEYCWFPTNTDQTNCENIESLIDCGGDTDCTTGADIGDWRTDLFDESETWYREQLISYFECDASPVEYRSSREYFLIMEEKRSSCVNETHYQYQGKASSSWHTYFGPEACESLVCDSDNTTQINNKTAPLTPPCTSTSNTTANITIIDLIAIQVVPNADLVVGKKTLIRVFLTNSGTAATDGNVTLIIPAELTSGSGFPFKRPFPLIAPGANTTVDWIFTPTSNATNAPLTVEVTV